MSDLAERLSDLASRNAQPIADVVIEGLGEVWNDEDRKDAYLFLLAEGFMPPQAAKKLGTTGTYMRRFRNPVSQKYDKGFAQRFDEIMAPDGEHRTIVAQNTRTAMYEAALGGNVRAQEKILMAYDPEWSFLRPAAVQGDVNVENLMIVMKDLPTEIIQQARDALAAKMQRELPVIDAG